jgi:hypothetical protein
MAWLLPFCKYLSHRSKMPWTCIKQSRCCKIQVNNWMLTTISGLVSTTSFRPWTCLETGGYSGPPLKPFFPARGCPRRVVDAHGQGRAAVHNGRWPSQDCTTPVEVTDLPCLHDQRPPSPPLASVATLLAPPLPVRTPLCEQQPSWSLVPPTPSLLYTCQHHFSEADRWARI